jgi:hypothetical protein
MRGLGGVHRAELSEPLDWLLQRLAYPDGLRAPRRFVPQCPVAYGGTFRWLEG